MSTMTHSVTLTVQQCCTCHVTFAMPKEWDDSLQQSHVRFFCPAGHGQSYTGKSDVQKLTEQLATEKRRRGYSEATLTSTRDQLAATERSLRGHKAAKTRIKNRIAAGVCPCCNRSFQNVARHMSGQHPTFTNNQEESK